MLSGTHAEPEEETLSREGLRERRCLVSGDVLPEARLLRFVRAPDGAIVPDVEAKLPGRGMWVRAERASVLQAASKRLFAKAARAQVSVGEELAGTAEARLVERLLAHLGLARRAGELLLGFDSVEKALRGANPPPVLIEAAEASADGRRKLQAAATTRRHVPFVITSLSNAELSLALSRENVVHAALKPGRIAMRLIFEATRLGGFRPLKPWAWEGFSGG